MVTCNQLLAPQGLGSREVIQMWNSMISGFLGNCTVGKCLCCKKANTLVACHFSGYKKKKKGGGVGYAKKICMYTLGLYKSCESFLPLKYIFFSHTSHTLIDTLFYDFFYFFLYAFFITFNAVNVYSMYPLLYKHLELCPPLWFTSLHFTSNHFTFLFFLFF